MQALVLRHRDLSLAGINVFLKLNNHLWGLFLLFLCTESRHHPHSSITKPQSNIQLKHKSAQKDLRKGWQRPLQPAHQQVMCILSRREFTNCSFSLWASGLLRWELHAELKRCREVPAIKKAAHSLLLPSRCLCLEQGHPQLSHRSTQAGSFSSARRHPRHPTNKSYQFLRLRMGTYYTGRGITADLRRCLQFAVMTVFLFPTARSVKPMQKITFAHAPYCLPRAAWNKQGQFWCMTTLLLPVSRPQLSK